VSKRLTTESQRTQRKTQKQTRNKDTKEFFILLLFFGFPCSFSVFSVTLCLDASLPPPQGFFAESELLDRRANGLEEACGIDGITRCRLQIGDVFAPKAIELQHQHFAQIFAGHRYQGYAQMHGLALQTEVAHSLMSSMPVIADRDAHSQRKGRRSAS